MLSLERNVLTVVDFVLIIWIFEQNYLFSPEFGCFLYVQIILIYISVCNA